MNAAKVCAALEHGRDGARPSDNCRCFACFRVTRPDKLGPWSKFGVPGPPPWNIDGL